MLARVSGTKAAAARGSVVCRCSPMRCSPSALRFSTDSRHATRSQRPRVAPTFVITRSNHKGEKPCVNPQRACSHHSSWRSRRWPCSWRPARARRPRVRPRSPRRRRTTSSVIFFAADGLRQDLVESWAAKKSLPTFADLLTRGVAANDGGLLTQAPPNTGAGWYSLATGAWPGVHGSTNNTFPINGHVRQPHGRVRRGRAPGRDDRPGGRARRQEGRADRVGGRPRRRHQRPHRRLPRRSSPAAAWRRTTSPRPTTRRSRPRSASSSTIRRASPGQPAVPRRRARCPPPAGRTCRRRTALRRRCACACSTSASTSTA